MSIAKLGKQQARAKTAKIMIFYTLENNGREKWKRVRGNPW